MKKYYLLFIFIIVNYSFSQEYFSFNGTIYNEKSFKIFLKNKEKGIKKFKAHFIPNKIEKVKDSLIKYGTIAFLPREYELDKIYDNLLKPLPKFEIEKQKGGYFSSDSLVGKPTIINLWFTNCPPCIEEIPILNDLKQKYGDKINTIAITFQDRSKVMLFNQLHKFDFEILINAKKYIDSLGINGYPKIILLDKNNIIRQIPFGIYARDKNSSELLLKEFTKQIELLLNE